MKKTILILGTTMFLFVVGSTFVSCKNNTKQTKEENVEKTQKYQCPMKCEGDKTYSSAGKCPVCGMNLKKIE